MIKLYIWRFQSAVLYYRQMAGRWEVYGWCDSGWVVSANDEKWIYENTQLIGNNYRQK